MTDRTETIKPARIDLGDGDSLNLYRMSDDLTVVRFHGSNPNVQLSSAGVPTAALRAALDQVAPAGSYTRTDEADWKARAEKAEQERDEARGTVETLRTAVRERGTLIKDLRARAENAERQWNEADRRTAEAEEQRDQWKRHHDRVDGQWAKAEREVTKLRLAAESRPLTPDAITVEMCRRAYRAFEKSASWEDALTAALTEPPARPEGAEDIEAWLDGMPESIRLDGDEHQRLFANHLAHMGFSVPVTLAEVGLTEKNTEKENER